MLNQLSHPGTPEITFVFLKESMKAKYYFSNSMGPDNQVKLLALQVTLLMFSIAHFGFQSFPLWRPASPPLEEFPAQRLLITWNTEFT